MSPSKGTEPDDPHLSGSAAQADTVEITLLNGRYLLGPELGRGGFGVTYLATDRAVALRKVVVKILNDWRTAESASVKNFQGEMEALSRIDHPNVVGVIDYGESQTGQRFLVMQFASGETLRRMLRREQLPLPVIAEIVKQMGSALTAVHDAGVIHSDIKPENIMIRTLPDGGHQVKLIDFGVASLFASEAVSLSTTLRGTFTYMAPEQFEGRSSVASDIYQLGIVTWEMVTGSVPFKTGTPLEIALEQREGLKTMPRQSRADLPEAGERAIVKALSLNPSDRFARAREFGDVLSGALVSGTFPGSTSGIDRLPPRSRSPVWPLRVIGLLAILATLAGFGLWAYFHARPATPVADFVAVMPFENRTGDPELAYLAGGITESLIGDLSRIPTLRVSALASVQKYQGTHVDVRAAGRELGAARVIGGSISKRDDNLFVDTELIDVKLGTRMWGKAYSTEMSSITGIIQKFSSEVTDQLRLKLSGPLRERLRRQYAVGSKSYEEYLKARFYLGKRTPEAFNQAVKYFEEVIASDPGYAPAQAGLADTYARMAVWGPFWSGEEPRDALERARSASQAALQLDGTLAEAYNALAMVELTADYDWAAAERDYVRSIELDPNFGETHENYAMQLAAMGRSADAIREMERAEILEPGNSHFRQAHGLILYMGRKYDDSLAIYNEIAATPQGAAQVAEVMAMNYWMKSRPAQALKMVDLIPRELPELRTPLTVTAYARMKQPALAREFHDKYYLHGGRSWWYHLAVAHLNMGRLEPAIQDLENAYQQRWGDVVWIGVDPMFDDLRSDSRFLAILKRTKMSPRQP